MVTKPTDKPAEDEMVKKVEGMDADAHVSDGDALAPVADADGSAAAVENQEAQEEEEEVFDFDPDEERATGERRWYAMARFYSAQRSRGLFDEIGTAWRSEKPIPVRPLDGNRFILEFEEEDVYKFVLNGGPWRHKGDALIVVPYDGFTRPSEIIIDSIDLWVRFYDVPISMMTSAFAGVLARKVSTKVLKVEGPVQDFLRAKVTYPLEESLKPTVEVKLKGKGSIFFDVIGSQLLKVQAASSATNQGSKRKERETFEDVLLLTGGDAASTPKKLLPNLEAGKQDRVSGQNSYAGSSEFTAQDPSEAQDGDTREWSVQAKLQASK
ncbi:hypothetical protein C2845_PM13G18720 [Panicum miliaceum]|uniref:Uncharacterized protein n=1 Tax=Panicum miliaceum TaxID=4540 RepID=A0A3L6RHN2_PANMI|nr:hypothetical protein C2845_PM13G18720 [Panicum miliaceum]